MHAPRALLIGSALLLSCTAGRAEQAQTLYTYTLHGADASAYDEAVAASSIEGIINRSGPTVYLLSEKDARPAKWLELFSTGGRWLSGRPRVALASLEDLIALAHDRLKGAVVWDPAVPATIDVATTAAGVEDLVVLSPELAARLSGEGKVRVTLDLRGKFTGAETGSPKNDAYRWALRRYVDTGLCSVHRLCMFEDAWTARKEGRLGYAVTRDWAVFNRSFTFDLSPWADETPADDPRQRLGLDRETYLKILASVRRQTAGRATTEMTGFFVFKKYSNEGGRASVHEPVPTEWETVWQISPFNVYQNTVSEDCYNQSLHSQFPRELLRQKARPAPAGAVQPKAYVCIFMADYDSSTPLYDFLPDNWADPVRGSLPLAWGINPNLVETYPDIIRYVYDTASPNDTFTADASAAGYTNPNRIAPGDLRLFVAHNRRFFTEADMDVAPMVLDFDQPSEAVQDAFHEFAPSGMGTIVYDFHNRGGRPPMPHLWKGMPVTELINDAGAPDNAEVTGDRMARAIDNRGLAQPGFYLFRIVWTKPSTVVDALRIVRGRFPGAQIEVVDIHTYFSLVAQQLQAGGPVPHAK
jgi:GxGYxYP putative glycoside hydrolase C-terminal domain/GxGYxY sequence motif in domain of unknown function N-terminal